MQLFVRFVTFFLILSLWNTGLHSASPEGKKKDILWGERVSSLQQSQQLQEWLTYGEALSATL